MNNTLAKLNSFFVLLPAFFLFVSLSSCTPELADDAAELSAANLSVAQCDDLDIATLDLSPGFRGLVTKNQSGPEFSVSNHDSKYDFLPSIAAEGCNGYCAFKIKFAPDNPEEGADYSSLEVAEVNLTFTSGLNQYEQPVTNYSWTYPNLIIETVVVNALGFYSIDFDGGSAQGLHVVETTVVGGLCVVENVDLVDPPYVVFPVGIGNDD